VSGLDPSVLALAEAQASHDRETLARLLHKEVQLLAYPKRQVNLAIRPNRKNARRKK